MNHGDREQPAAYDPYDDRSRSNWDTQLQPVIGGPAQPDQSAWSGHGDLSDPSVRPDQQWQGASPTADEPPQQQHYWQQGPGYAQPSTSAQEQTGELPIGYPQSAQPEPQPQPQQWQAPQPQQFAGYEQPQAWQPQQPSAYQQPQPQQFAGHEQPQAWQPQQPSAYQQPQPQPWQLQQSGDAPMSGPPQVVGPPSPGQPLQGQWQQPLPPGPQPPAKQSRRGLWIGLTAGAVALVLIVCSGLAFVFLRFKPDKVEGLPPPPTKSSRPSNVPRKPPSAVTIVRPEKIGNRNRITTGEYGTKTTKTEETLKSSLKPGGSLAVGYYGTTDRKVDQIYLVASTIPGPLKKSTFDKQFENTGPSIGGKPTTNIVDIPAGTLGGFIKCGQTTLDGMDVAVCAFSNEYDYAVVQWYNRKLNEEIKKEIVAIRLLLEK